MKQFMGIFDFHASTVLRAFVLNAIVVGMITGLSIELRRIIDDEAYTKGISEIGKILMTITGTSAMGFIIYIVIRFIFGFGDGLVATKRYPKFL